MTSDKTKLSILKRRIYKHLWFFRPLFYLLIFAAFVLVSIYLLPKFSPFLKKLGSGSKTALSLINPAIKNLNQYQSRTNILLLGIGGGDHPGGDLTDSIMLVSTNLSTGDTVLVSLPRDIWIESLSAKLNAAYRFGEEQQPGGGLVLAKSAVSEIINQPIHYGVLLDFSGFEQAIDIVGGITLNVPHAFVDKKYPISGKETVQPEEDRYETLSFSSGVQDMDGATALKYVRSRHAEGEEGTDYARAQRQQRVILALKEKLLTARMLLSPKKLNRLNKAFKTSVKTDIPTHTYPDMLKLAARIDKENIRTGIIDQGSENEDIPSLLYHPPDTLYGQWVLLPINNYWQAVFDYVQEILYQ